MPQTKTEFMQKIANDYLKLVGNDGATADDIARWAVAHGRYAPPESYIIDKCAEELADAMRLEIITDPQGRRVRAKHAARILKNGKQSMFWADGRTAPHDHMRRAFGLRRQQVVGDLFHLKQDVDSYNENRSPEVPIQMPLDFTPDVLELEAERAQTTPKMVSFPSSSAQQRPSLQSHSGARRSTSRRAPSRL